MNKNIYASFSIIGLVIVCFVKEKVCTTEETEYWTERLKKFSLPTDVTISVFGPCFSNPSKVFWFEESFIDMIGFCRYSMAAISTADSHSET